jgi:hypothetical protein
VRSDDIMLARQLFDDPEIADAIAKTITQPVDLLELSSGRVRVRRVAGRGGDSDKFEAAREAWPLAAAVVERLGLPPAG